MAIVRRVAAGAKVLLGDVSEKNLERAAEAMRFNGYDVETMVVNALDKDEVYAFAARAAELGDVMWFVDTAGASPSQATPQFIIDLDLIGTSYALDAFGPVMARGGAGHVDSQPAGVTKCALNAEPGRTRAA
jgi:NADP-dependent 3-hydroxy acid dehydrogenase YdfG